MGEVWVKEFVGGLDTRRLPITTSGGVLTRCTNAHINRGGELEKRAAFVKTHDLPADETIGLAASASSLTVFGHDGEPGGMPSGIEYQQLTHPTPSREIASVPSYDLYAGLLYTVAVFDDGSRYHFYDGDRVEDWYDGRARAAFDVTSSSGTLTSITVDGVTITNASVAWATSTEDTAQDIADSINALTSTPNYTATAVGTTVNIIAATSGSEPNGRVVAFATSGGFTVDPSSLSLSGGSAADFTPGGFVKTIRSRVHSVSGPNEHFSGISEPTGWTTDILGAGFIDMSTQAQGSEELKALGDYQQYVAVFAERTIQLWYFDPDPELHAQQQILNNTGTASPRSVTQFGDNDLFYADESGLRSLRARDSSNSAATTDIGVPVDTLIVAKLRGLTDAQREKVFGLIEPQSGRFWLCMLDQIFVFSFFSGSKISAWSTYTPSYFDDEGEEQEITIDEAIVFQRRVYIRSGDKVFAFGGVGSEMTYDASVAEVWLPYLDANTPSMRKKLKGMDAAVSGSWAMSVGLNPNDPDTEEVVSNITKSTFPEQMIPAEGEFTHISPRFRTTGSTAAVLSSVVIHYDPVNDEDS